MKFAEFLAKWRDGSLHDSATWRAYAFEDNVSPQHVTNALRMMGLVYAGELAIPHFMSLYGLTNRDQARTIVGAWYRFKMVEDGRRIMAKPRQLSLDLGGPKPSLGPCTTPAK